MKVAISTKLVLVLPNFNEKFVLETDASNYGVRTILMQKEQPLAYFSKKLSLRMQQASAYVRKLYAITEAVKKIASISLGHFLYGSTRRVQELCQIRLFKHLNKKKIFS